MDHANDRTPVTVSVVMATYNGQRFLPEQLASIAAQTRLPDELLIIDDGSRDGTPQILEEWATRHPWIRLKVNDGNQGINPTFWRLLQESIGSHVFISDQDDVWLPHKIETMLASIGSKSLLASDAAIIDEQGRSIRHSELCKFGWTPAIGEPNSVLLSVRSFVSGHNILVRRELIRALPPPPPTQLLTYDRWLTLGASVHGSVGILAEPLCLHRFHQENATRRHPGRKQTPREEKELPRRFSGRSLIALLPYLRQLEGADRHFDAYVAELSKGATALPAGGLSWRIFWAIWRRRAVIFPDFKWRKALRRSLRLASSN